MKTKKLTFVVLVMAMLIIVSASLVACNSGNSGSSAVSVTYMVDGEVAKTARLEGFSEINGFYKPTKIGYSFDGWYVNADLTEKFSRNDQIKDNLVLYAKFSIKSFVVDFFGEDGSLIDSQTIFYGGSALAPDAPEVSGKTFVGWDKDFTNVTSTLAVYAIYEEVALFTANFYSLHVEFWEYGFVAGSPTDVVLNSAFEELDVPNGLKFVKWSLTNGEDVPEVFPEHSLDIMAVYEMVEIEYLNIVSSANQSSITYNPDATVTFTAELPTFNDPLCPISYTYVWTVNGVDQSAGGNSVTLSNLVVGTYDVALSVTAACSVGHLSKEASTTLTVSPAPMTVTATGASLTYDGQPHSITVNSIPGDVVEYKFADGNWTSSLSVVNAGTYEIYYRVSRANHETYESTQPVVIVIDKKELVGTVLPTNLVYGDTLPTTYQVELTGFVDGDDQSVVNGDYIFVPSVQDALTVGQFDVNVDVSGVSADNYFVTASKGVINVAKKVLTATASDLSIIYCDSVTEYPISYDGFIVGDSIADIDTLPTATSAHTWDSPVGQYEIVVSGGEDDHYTFEHVNGTLTVERKIVTITAKDATIAYGTKLEDVEFEYSLSDFIRDEITVTFTAPEYSTSLDAGNTVDLIPYTESENYTYWFAKGKLTVVKRNLMVTADDVTVVFGNTIAKYGVSFDGFAEGEDAEVLDERPQASTNYVAGVSAVGTYDMVVSGGQDVNYAFNYVKGTVTVTKRPMTIKATDMTLVYGETLDPATLNFSTEDEIVGAMDLEISVPTFTEGAIPGTTFDIVVTSDNQNYDFTFVGGTLTIVKKDATITAGDATIIYGEDLGTITLTYTQAGVLPGDVVTVELIVDGYTTSATPGSTFAVKASSNDNRYAFTFVDGTLTVVKKDITVKANDASVVYGSDADLSTLTSAITGLVGEDTIDVTYTTDYVAGQDAGKVFDITPHASHDYYNVTIANGALTVLKKDATIKVDSAEVTYGDTLPTLTATAEGTVGEDTLAYTFAHNYEAGVTPVGETPLSVTLGNNPNYNVAVEDATIEVGKRTIEYTLTAETASIWYNTVWTNAGLVSGHVASGTLTFVGTELGTYTYPNGFEWTTAFDVKADGESVLSNYNPVFNVSVDLIKRAFEFNAEDKYVTYNGQDQTIEVTDVILSEDASSQGYTAMYSVDELTWSTTPLTFKNAGDYKVYYVVTPDDSIYYPESASGYFTLHISTKELTATVDSKSKTYGDTNPTFTGTLEGVCDGDVVEVEYFLTNNAEGKNVGEYTITANFATAQPNYTLKVVAGTLMVVQRALTITADDKVITYGDTVNFNSHGFTAVGVQYGETIYVTYSTDYVTGADAGEYTITPALNGEYNNYNVTLVDGTLTVGKKDATVTANNVDVVYGNALPALTSTITGLVGEDTVDVTYSHEYVVGAVPGTTLAITPSAVDDNYNFTFVDGTITVLKKDIVISADNQSVIYGNALPTLTSTITGLVGEDTVDVTYTTDYMVGANAGATFAITPSATHPYYNITLADGTLTVAKRPATVTAGNMSVIYGSVADFSALEYTIDGLLTGDSATVVFSSSYVAGNGVGTYAITPHATNDNYAFTAVDGTLTVNPKDATVSVDSKTVTYGDPLPTLTITTSGVIDGDTLNYTFNHSYTPGATGVGAVDVTVTLGSNPNYNVTVLSAGAITVTKRDVTITAPTATVKYNSAMPATVVAGEVDGYPVNYTVNCGYTVGSDAGNVYDVTIVLGENPNYNVTYTNGQITVIKADPVQKTHKAINGGVYNYNKTLSEFALDEGFSWVNGSTVPVVNNSGYRVCYNPDPANYEDYYFNIEFILTKAPVTITGTTTQIINATANGGFVFSTEDFSIAASDGNTSIAKNFASSAGTFTFNVASTYQFTVSLVNDNYEGSVLCTFIIKSVDVGGTLYTIEDALNVATSGNVIVKYNTAFSSVVGYYNGSQYYTVKSGVTLLLPFEAADTKGWLGGAEAGNAEFDRLPDYSPSQNASVPRASLYVSLDVPASINISVSGTVVVGAFTGSKTGGTYQNEVSGGYAQINLNGNITLNSATLRVMGYIKGSGTITANNSTVIENMVLTGWTGGTIGTARYAGNGAEIGVTKIVTGGDITFSNPTQNPFSQYELRSIQTKLIINYGSKLQGYVKIATGEQSMSFITIKAQTNDVLFNIVSSDSAASSGLIRLSSGARVTKSFAGDRVRLVLDGTIADGYTAMTMKVIGCTATLSSEKVLFPVDGRIDIVLNSGATFTQNYKLKFMPGATLTISAGATYNLNGSSIFYTHEFVDDQCPLYYPGPERGDSILTVNGTMNLNGSFGGVIRSSANGGKVVVGSSATLSITSKEGIGDYSIKKTLGIPSAVVFSYTETATVTKSATLSNGTAVATGTTYTYNGSNWA